MNIYTTEVKAIDPIDGKLKTFSGQRIQALSWSLAEQYCQLNGLGYLKITGVLVADIDYTENTKTEIIDLKLN